MSDARDTKPERDRTRIVFDPVKERELRRLEMRTNPEGFLRRARLNGEKLDPATERELTAAARDLRRRRGASRT